MGKTRQTANLVSDGNITVDISNDRIGIGTTNPTNAVIHVEGRNFAFGGPGLNIGGEGNLYLGNYSNPLNDPWDRNIRIGSRNEIQIEMLTDWGGSPSQYSDSIIFSSPDSFGIQYNNVRNGIQRSGIYPLYYSISTSSLEADNLSLFDNGIIGKVNIRGGGEVLIGSATTTGTSNQKLQVTGGGYFSGNVGIGITNPSEKLEVTGKVRIFDGGYPYIDIGITTSNYFRIVHDNPNDRLYIGKNNNPSLVITGGNNVEPGADATQNLGASNKRWANIYSADLQLSNEGSQNDVDGTWGQYTIQEGENDLFLINRRNGKKYKFVLQEVN